MLFSEASRSQTQAVKECLDKFCSLSGQTISLTKSRIFFSLNVTTQDAYSINNFCGIPTIWVCLLFIIKSLRVKSTYGHVAEKIKSKLLSWKSNCLSLAGKDTQVWGHSSNGVFTAKLAYAVKHNLDQSQEWSPAFIWKMNIPPKNDGTISVRRVIRDDCCSWCWGFSANKGCGSVLDAALWGLLHSLQIALDKNLVTICLLGLLFVCSCWAMPLVSLKKVNLNITIWQNQSCGKHS
ncbi:hypothetical protein Pint_13580 [Pistacia integerrima]|uniref:Uncharacterized protein n=1 Tax=Pistacia integerrima TaxID=434235 RepID=A0ACC0YB85_9ROSI|nr:hypothetical protein Pint_13580 [Pistacia integerrima]